MYDPSAELNDIIDISLSLCQSWLVDDGAGGLRLQDPIDKKVVVAHYGDSHFAAGLIILGQRRDKKSLIDLGVKITASIIRGWGSAQKLNDFHHDFNNFALCIIEDCIQATHPEVSCKIRQIVTATRDSKHDTINWLPLRAYVNISRHRWTGRDKYLKSAERCMRIVSGATNSDGGIEDRLPFGASYNLQYNVSSLAALVFLKKKWPQAEYDFVIAQSFLLNNMLPDGDINYVGRGTNQIFAWGPWLYLLSSGRFSAELKKALTFLVSRYSVAAENNNILLNGLPGDEKLFWWDYHFCSVYHSHFFLWAVLAYFELLRGESFEFNQPNFSIGEGKKLERSTGLSVTCGESGGAVVFGGRSIYLAESGPALCALWLSDGMVLFKGGLGPWQGLFGKKYSYADLAFLNHFGLISEKESRPVLGNLLAQKLGQKYSESRSAFIRPIFSDLNVEFSNTSIRVIINTKDASGYFNVPLLAASAKGIVVSFSVDGRGLDSIVVGEFQNQYGRTNVVRSRVGRGNRWEVTITRRG